MGSEVKGGGNVWDVCIGVCGVGDAEDGPASDSIDELSSGCSSVDSDVCRSAMTGAVNPGGGASPGGGGGGAFVVVVAVVLVSMGGRDDEGVDVAARLDKAGRTSTFFGGEGAALLNPFVLGTESVLLPLLIADDNSFFFFSRIGGGVGTTEGVGRGNALLVLSGTRLPIFVGRGPLIG